MNPIKVDGARDGVNGAPGEHPLAEHALEVAESLLWLPEPRRGVFSRAGLSPRAERVFHVVSGIVLALFTTGWTWSVATARAGVTEDAEGGAVTAASASVARALTAADAPTASFLMEKALEAFSPERGLSGKLQAEIRMQGERMSSEALPEGAHVEFHAGTAAESASVAAAPRKPGVWEMAVKVGSAIKPLADFSVITLRPLSEKRGGRIGSFIIGNWPNEKGGGRARYTAPRGFIEVTPENQDTRLSQHFRLRDFLTKGQNNVWPKYLVIETRLIDKLELTLGELQKMGIDPSGVFVMSGFRTPSYNARGGNTAGRAALSRHMYGDAADIFIDNDRDGWMDDLNKDGKRDLRDAEVIGKAAERVEQNYAELVGGVGVYVASSGHGPFTHIDTRGYRARWIGRGD